MLALAGCTLGPNYQRPAEVFPKAFQYEAKDAAETADTLWWQQFRDPVLEQLIDEALKHNTNVQIAAANVAQAAAFLTQTRSQFFPALGYGAGAQRDAHIFAAATLLFVSEGCAHRHRRQWRGCCSR